MNGRAVYVRCLFFHFTESDLKMLDWTRLFLEEIGRDMEQPARIAALHAANANVSLIIQGCETDDAVLQQVLYWHSALLPNDLLARFTEIIPAELQAHPVTQLLNAIVVYSTARQRNVDDWQEVYHLFEVCPPTDLDCLRTALIFNYRFLCARNAGMDAQTLDYCYRMAAQNVEHLDGPTRHLMLGFIFFNRARQQISVNSELAWDLYENAGNQRWAWFKHLTRAMSMLSGDFRVIAAATQAWKLWDAADKLFGDGSKEKLSIHELAKGLEETFPVNREFAVK